MQNYIQDDAEINIYFPNLPISEGKDGAHSTENDQQFSHKDVEASEGRFNAEYETGTAGEEGDDSGDRKDRGAEGGKGDDTAKRNHGEDEDAAKESQEMRALIKIMELGMKKRVIMIHHHHHHRLVHLINVTGHKTQKVNCKLPELAPWKCQKDECDRLVHVLCQSEWEQREGHDNTAALYCCLHHPNYINKNQSETNDNSQGTEWIDSAQDKADASVAQHGTGSSNKDGGTGTHTMPSADPKVDAIESSVVGEKEDDLAEKKGENKDNIDGAGKGGVVDEGGNGVNENANPQNYQGYDDGGNKHQKDEDNEKKPLMETMGTVMKMMEVVKKSEQKMIKRKKI